MGDTRERIIYEADATQVNRASREVESRFGALRQQVGGIQQSFSLLNRAMAGFGAVKAFEMAIEKAAEFKNMVESTDFEGRFAAAGGAKPGSRAAGAKAEVDTLRGQLGTGLGDFLKAAGFSAMGLGATMIGRSDVADYAEQQIHALHEVRDVLKERLQGAQITAEQIATAESANRARSAGLFSSAGAGLDRAGMDAFRAAALAGQSTEELLTLIAGHLERIAQASDRIYEQGRQPRGAAIVDVAAAGPG